jgi:hypothetical protein
MQTKDEPRSSFFSSLQGVSQLGTYQDTIPALPGIPDAFTFAFISMDMYRQIVVHLQFEGNTIFGESTFFNDNVHNYMPALDKLTSQPSCSCFVTCREINIHTVAFRLIADSERFSKY